MLLVADALTGQDAVNLARSFDERVGLTGIVLTRVDGDGRGGAALSMRAVTGKPIKLIGTGEKTDALEDFHPSRIAGRILGMGDVVSLVEKAAANIDAEKAARAAEKMRKGQFDLADMREQLLQMANMGGISGLMGMMPGIAKMKNQIAAAGIDDKIIKRQVAIIDSMTRQERKNPDILKASRKKRIAAGAGQNVEEVNKLLKMHRNMADMMKAMGSGKRGPMAGIAQAMGFGGGMRALAGTDEGDGRKKCRAAPGRAACRACRRIFPRACARACRICRGLPGLAASRTCRASAAFPWGRRNDRLPSLRAKRATQSRPSPRRHSGCFAEPVIGPAGLAASLAMTTNSPIQSQFELNRRTKCQSLSASLAQAPRSVRSITSSSPTRAFRATAASSSGSAISIRCCRRTTRRG